MADPARSNPLLAIEDQKTRFAPAFALLEKAVAENAFPGCTFGVLQAGQIIALAAVGRQTYAPDAPPILSSTRYDLASLTKVLATTSMAMLLYERQRLDLDQPLNSLLPGFACNAPAGSDRYRVTLRHLLAHASGLPGYARLFETAKTAGELFAACLCLPLEASPGTRAEYSDPGFILLGRALEAIAGEPIDIFCQREVFAPCGMRSTGFCPDPALRPAIPPTEEDTTFRHRTIQGEVQDENCYVLGGVSGHAGLFGTAEDILLYAASLLASLSSNRDAFPQRGKGLFLPETVLLFSTRAGMPFGNSRALGWDTPSPPSSSGSQFFTHSIGHLGYAGTSLWIDLEAGIAIVLLTNRTWPQRQSQQIREVRPALHDSIRSSAR